MLSVLFVFLTLALVMFLVFKKVNIVIASLAAAILLALLDGQNILTAMTDTFMTGASNYIKSFFLLFFVSALFGKVMESTGAAASIARGLANLLGEKYAILGVLFAGIVLCYGGISALVIAFTMYPLALAVFKRANLPRRLIPGAIAAGCFTFAAAALPGTPQTINVTPTSYLGTTVTAAPVLGIICGVVGIALTCGYMYWEGAQARGQGRWLRGRCRHAGGFVQGGRNGIRHQPADRAHSHHCNYHPAGRGPSQRPAVHADRKRGVRCALFQKC